MSKNTDEFNSVLSLIPNDTLEFSKFIKEKNGKTKLINSLNLTSDRFMSKVLENKLACQEIINIILGRDDIIVDDVITQYSIPNIDNHSVRLDVMCHDSTGNIYEIEIQNLNKGLENDTRRVRYIQGSIDTSILATSDEYSKLPNLHIIFIANYDPIGEDRPIYHIKRVIEESGNILDNGVNEIYLNLKKLSDDEELRELQKFFVNSVPNYKTNYFPALADRITTIKSQEGGSDDMCEIFDKLEMMYEKVGYERGEEDGKEQGIKNLIESLNELNITKEDTISKLKDKFNIDDLLISEYMNKYWK